MRVELDVYSGRSNPAWTLSEAETRELARRLVGAPPAAPRSGEPGLGYRGFVIDGPEQLAELPVPLRIHDGIITIDDLNYQDTNGIEAWLIGLARQHGFADFIGTIDG